MASNSESVVSGEFHVYEPVTKFYFIRSRAKDNFVLQVQDCDNAAQLGNYITIAKRDEAANVSATHFHQHFYFEKSPDAGYVYIISRKNGHVLHVEPKHPFWTHTFIINHERNSPPSPLTCQRWKIQKNGFITSQLNGQVLTVRTKNFFQKPDVYQYVVIDTKYKNEYQEWVLEPVQSGSNDHATSQRQEQLQATTLSVSVTPVESEPNDAQGQLVPSGGNSLDPLRTSGQSAVHVPVFGRNNHVGSQSVEHTSTQRVSHTQPFS